MLRSYSVAALLAASVCSLPSFCRDTILEFKGAYFLPTNHTFRQAFDNGSAIYGPELSVQLKNDAQWYGFASIDYFQKRARYLGVLDSTRLRMLLFAIGLKYFIPVSERVNLYLGAGAEPAYVLTKSTRACVVARDSQWCIGGIGKMGAYIDMPHNFVFDIFFDYSFLRTHCGYFYGHTLTPSQANLSGAIFGVGLGYRF